MESVWLRLAAGPRRRSDRLIWVFLAPGRFAAKSHADEGWIVLDFLGFSRPNRAFQWSRGLRWGRVLTNALSLTLGAPQRAPVLLACGSAGLFMGQA